MTRLTSKKAGNLSIISNQFAHRKTELRFDLLDLRKCAADAGLIDRFFCAQVIYQESDQPSPRLRRGRRVWDRPTLIEFSVKALL